MSAAETTVLIVDDMNLRQLDWAMSVIEKMDPRWDEVSEDYFLPGASEYTHLEEFRPSSAWVDAGALISREKPDFEWCDGGDIQCRYRGTLGYGPDYPEAFVRAYVSHHLGMTIKASPELVKFGKDAEQKSTARP